MIVIPDKENFIFKIIIFSFKIRRVVSALDGRILCELKKLREESPGYFARTVQKEWKLNIVEFAKFRLELDNLK